MARRTAGPEIERLIQLMSKVPGLGPRSARRAVLHLIKRKEPLFAPLTAAMADVLEQVSGLHQLRQRGFLPIPARCAPTSERDGGLGHLRRRAGRRPLGVGAHRRLSRAGTTCWAARCRRSTASARRSSTSPAWWRAPARMEVKEVDPGDQRHGRRPDHRPLHHRPARRRRCQRLAPGPRRARRR